MKSMKFCLSVWKRSFSKTIKILKRKLTIFSKSLILNLKILRNQQKSKTSLLHLIKKWKELTEQFKKLWVNLLFWKNTNTDFKKRNSIRLGFHSLDLLKFSSVNQFVFLDWKCLMTDFMKTWERKLQFKKSRWMK